MNRRVVGCAAAAFALALAVSGCSGSEKKPSGSEATPGGAGSAGSTPGGSSGNTGGADPSGSGDSNDSKGSGGSTGSSDDPTGSGGGPNPSGSSDPSGGGGSSTDGDPGSPGTGGPAAPNGPKPGKADRFTMPPLVGISVLTAQDAMSGRGAYTITFTDATGAGREVPMSSDWITCSQNPARGAKVDIAVHTLLTAVPAKEGCP